MELEGLEMDSIIFRTSTKPFVILFRDFLICKVKFLCVPFLITQTPRMLHK